MPSEAKRNFIKSTAPIKFSIGSIVLKKEFNGNTLHEILVYKNKLFNVQAFVLMTKGRNLLRTTKR